MIFLVDAFQLAGSASAGDEAADEPSPAWEPATHFTPVAEEDTAIRGNVWRRR